MKDEISSTTEEAYYVVVGGGIAGVSCVESISRLKPHQKIILVSASPVVKTVTSIVPVTKVASEFCVGIRSLTDLSGMYPNLIILHDTVVEIESKKQLVKTGGGTELHYEKLCLCMGAVPKVVIPDNEYVIGIRDVDSAAELQDRLKSAQRIAVIGNGGIATELIYEISGPELLWVIKDKHISAAFIDPGAAEFFQDVLKQRKDGKSIGTPKPRLNPSYTADHGRGMKNLPGAALGPDWHRSIKLSSEFCAERKLTVEYEAELQQVLTPENVPSKSRMDSEVWPVYVHLTNGKVYGCNFVISATGVLPNSKTINILDAELDLAEDQGIKVDSEMRTNINNIFAAGDVCTAAWNLAAHWVQMRLWTQARHMGCYAGRVMSSDENIEMLQDFSFELFTHVTKFFGFKVVLLGLFNGQKLGNDYEIALRTSSGEEYIKLVIKDHRLQGAVLIGDTDLEEMAENLILSQIDISSIQDGLLDPNVDIEDYFD